MVVLQRFSVDDLVMCSRAVRELGAGATDMTTVAQRTVAYFMSTLLDEDGGPGCGIVQIHKTQAFGTLPPRLQAVAREADPDVEDATVCLVQLATSDDVDTVPREPGSQVRPLTEREVDSQPIIVRLLDALGVDLDTIRDPSRVLSLKLQHHSLNVYLEQDLATSAVVPDDAAREAIAATGVRSLVAIGGILPSGDLLLASMFTLVEVDPRVADLMRSLATAMKAAMIPFTFLPYPPEGPVG